MRSAPILSFTLFAAAALLAPAFAADVSPATDVKPTLPPVPAPAATAPATEPEVIDNRSVPVTPKKELSISARNDADVASRELWYSAYDGKAWGAWQKHGIAFPRETPITWAAPEGHWRIFIRIIQTSGLANPVPVADTKSAAEFIVDRTAPAVAVGFPKAKDKLRGGDKYAVKWEVSDPHLRTTPITVKYARDGATFVVVADKLPNSGTYDWTVPVDMTTTGTLRIEAADKAGNVGVADATGLLVDSIKPKGRVTGPAISNTPETTLTLEIADQGPAGLASARLFISRDDGTSWGEGPWIQDPKAVAWKAPEDGKYRLAVVATDQAGNASPTPKGKADDQFTFTIDTTAPSILLTSVIGITEAEKAGPAARRDFKPGDRVAVPFTVKDANLTAGTVAVYLQTDPAKPWVELATKQAADAAYRFEIPNTATKTARIKVTAADAAGNIGEAVASETFTIQTEVQAGEVQVNLN